MSMMKHKVDEIDKMSTDSKIISLFL